MASISRNRSQLLCCVHQVYALQALIKPVFSTSKVLSRINDTMLQLADERSSGINLVYAKAKHRNVAKRQPMKIGRFFLCEIQCLSAFMLLGSILIKRDIFPLKHSLSQRKTAIVAKKLLMRILSIFSIFSFCARRVDISLTNGSATSAFPGCYV